MAEAVRREPGPRRTRDRMATPFEDHPGCTGASPGAPETAAAAAAADVGELAGELHPDGSQVWFRTTPEGRPPDAGVRCRCGERAWSTPSSLGWGRAGRLGPARGQPLPGPGLITALSSRPSPKLITSSSSASSCAVGTGPRAAAGRSCSPMVRLTGPAGGIRIRGGLLLTGPGARPDRAHPHEKPRHRHSGWAAQRHPEATSTRAKRDSPREPRERPALVGGARGFDSREQRTKEHHKREGSCMGSWGQSVSDRPQRPGRAALYGCGEGCASDDTARGQAGAVAPADDDAKAGHGPGAVAPPHPAPPGATTRSRARRSKPAEAQLDSFQPPLLMVPTEADAVPDREITVTPRRTPALRSSVPSCPQAGSGVAMPAGAVLAPAS